MKRVLAIAAVTAVLFALVGSHESVAGGPKKKVKVCHVPDGKKVGFVIEISRNALPAHCKHGDSNVYKVISKDGACIPARRCIIKLPPK
jgi:hypothetical protein